MASIAGMQREDLELLRQATHRVTEAVQDLGALTRLFASAKRKRTGTGLTLSLKLNQGAWVRRFQAHRDALGEILDRWPEVRPPEPGSDLESIYAWLGRVLPRLYRVVDHASRILRSLVPGAILDLDPFFRDVEELEKAGASWVASSPSLWQRLASGQAWPALERWVERQPWSDIDWWAALLGRHKALTWTIVIVAVLSVGSVLGRVAPDLWGPLFWAGILTSVVLWALWDKRARKQAARDEAYRRAAAARAHEHRHREGEMESEAEQSEGRCPLCRLDTLMRADQDNYICMNCGWSKLAGHGFLTEMADDITDPTQR